MTSSTTSRTVVVCAALLTTACGPDLRPIAGEGDGSGNEGDGSGNEGGSSSTGVPSECTEVVEGDLEITDASDFEWLRTVREVTGHVRVQDLTIAEDLSMLSCLEVAGGGLWAQDTKSLRSLRGVGRLRSVGTWPDGVVRVDGNLALETLAGLDGLEEIGTIRVWDNPNLSRLEVNAVKRLGNLMLGWVECVPPGVGGVAMPRGDNPKLTEIDGFEALESGALSSSTHWIGTPSRLSARAMPSRSLSGWQAATMRSGASSGASATAAASAWHASTLWAVSSVTRPCPAGSVSSRPTQRTPSSRRAVGSSTPRSRARISNAASATAPFCRWCGPASPTGATASGVTKRIGQPTRSAVARRTPSTSGT